MFTQWWHGSSFRSWYE